MMSSWRGGAAGRPVEWLAGWLRTLAVLLTYLGRRKRAAAFRVGRRRYAGVRSTQATGPSRAQVTERERPKERSGVLFAPFDWLPSLSLRRRGWPTVLRDACPVRRRISPRPPWLARSSGLYGRKVLGERESGSYSGTSTRRRCYPSPKGTPGDRRKPAAAGRGPGKSFLFCLRGLGPGSYLQGERALSNP